MASTALALLLAGCVSATQSGSLPNIALASTGTPVGPHASHVTVVIMENRDYRSIVGDAQSPYVNTKLIPQGALLKNSHAIGHPSEPNYLAIFSGSTHGVHSDECPVEFDAPNVASELLAAGDGFTGWSQSMPRDGYSGCYSGNYARKHNPWVDFKNVPASLNRVYTGWPSSVPSVQFIVPNLCNDMHDCSTRTGDTWLSKNLPQMISWDAANDGLLILTWDEAAPDNGGNPIATILVGPMVKAGSVDTQDVDHYGILRTIETIFGLRCIDKDCKGTIVTGIWQ